MSGVLPVAVFLVVVAFGFWRNLGSYFRLRGTLLGLFLFRGYVDIGPRLVPPTTAGVFFSFLLQRLRLYPPLVSFFY